MFCIYCMRITETTKGRFIDPKDEQIKISMHLCENCRNPKINSEVEFSRISSSAADLGN